MAPTSYTPTLTTIGDRQPVLGDGSITGSYDGDTIHVELVVGASTDLGEGPLQIGMPTVIDGINAPVTAGSASGWAALRQDLPSQRVVIADTIPLPIYGGDDLLWTGERLQPGDTLVLDGRMRAAPPPCPDCHVASGTVHTPGCTVALCRTCGYPAASCEHAGAWPRGMPLWKGHEPTSESFTFGYSTRDEVLAAAAAGQLLWHETRERWEPPPPLPPDLDIADYGFVAETAHSGGETQYVVRLPTVELVRARDKAKAEADMQRFIAQAQAALQQLQNL